MKYRVWMQPEPVEIEVEANDKDEAYDLAVSEINFNDIDLAYAIDETEDEE